jgi:hypothetical protein
VNAKTIGLMKYMGQPNLLIWHQARCCSLIEDMTQTGSGYFPMNTVRGPTFFRNEIAIPYLL